MMLVVFLLSVVASIGLVSFVAYVMRKVQETARRAHRARHRYIED